MGMMAQTLHAAAKPKHKPAKISLREGAIAPSLNMRTDAQEAEEDKVRLQVNRLICRGREGKAG